MIPVVGFAPDVDPTTPGVLLDCENIIPDLIGVKGGPSAVTPTDVPALAAACKGAAVVTKLDGTRRVFAGAQAAIYELSSGSWTDRSKGGGYTGGSEAQWSIAQFGDATLMANRADTIQRSTTGAFADIATAPKAEVVFSVGAFVMALNTNDGSEKTDGWHCCASFDETSWTPSVTTQAASGRLVSTPGPILTGGKLGEFAVAYKTNSMYLGQYVGPPSVWDWKLVPGGNAGCIGKNAWCDIGGSHFFVGEDNFWLFNGSAPVPLADGVLRQWFAVNCSAGYKYKTTCIFDKKTNTVWVFYPSTNASTLDSALVYHVLSKKWGRADRSIEAVLEYVTAGLTIDDMDDLSATIDGLPDIGLDSAYWTSSERFLSVFNTSHQLVSLTGDSDTSSITTGEVGDDDMVILLQRIRLRYAVAPTSATVNHFYKMNSGEELSTGATGTMDDGKFDILSAARWHKARIDFTGPVTITGMDAKHKPAGTR